MRARQRDIKITQSTPKTHSQNRQPRSAHASVQKKFRKQRLYIGGKSKPPTNFEGLSRALILRSNAHDDKHVKKLHIDASCDL